ncbi:20493_t:CDS:2 [Cetraspora pellucida]|uniref:20493_t:CDS:1 n=1 Tax=Cetraspora pellucida TaxID=1433469 RepID=A0A9N9I3E7_9GLOM|nr:20493_t:CDS:2 [Cetraspora pellucida]
MPAKKSVKDDSEKWESKKEFQNLQNSIIALEQEMSVLHIKLKNISQHCQYLYFSIYNYDSCFSNMDCFEFNQSNSKINTGPSSSNSKCELNPAKKLFQLEECINKLKKLVKFQKNCSEVDVDVGYVRIDCLDIGNFIESEINELAVSDDDVINTVYQTNLLVNLDTTPDVTAKDVAALVITEIEGGNDFSWK